MAEIPREWKPAGSGEEELDWLLYDTEADGDAGNEYLTFFDELESSADETDNNMQTAGQLPSTHRFLVKKITVELDTEVATNDVKDLCDKASLELQIANKRMLVGPLTQFLGGPAFLPQAATETISHFFGKGFELEKAIALNGGVPFKVMVRLGDTSASAAMNIFVILRGRLVRPA